MRSLPYLAIALLVSVAELAAAEDPPQNTIREPLTAMERSATARLTRLHSARLWWNDDNRAMGASFKGSDANDASIRLVSRLPGLRTLVIVAPPENNLTDHGLAPLANLPNLELLSISGDRIGDEGLVHIQQLPKLRTLVLNCNVSDAGLEMICHLSNLEQLDLTQSHVTDSGLAYLRNLPKLNTLILNGTQIADEGLAQIAELKTVQRLYLGNTVIDDSAVEQLSRMDQLSLLFLRDTRMTANGISMLQPALLETCEIIHQSGRYRGGRSTPVAMAQASSRASAWRPSK